MWVGRGGDGSVVVVHAQERAEQVWSMPMGTTYVYTYLYS